MIKALLRTLLIVIILIIAMGAFILTPTGLRWGVHVASTLLPGQLTYQKISGVIIGPLTIDQLHYQDKEESIDIGKLHINWQPLDLFKKQLHIDTLTIQQLHIITNKKILPDQWNEKTARQLFNELQTDIKNETLPFLLIVNQADITQLNIVNPSTTLQIKKMTLHSVLTKNKWDAQFLAIIDKPEPYELKFALLGKPSAYVVDFSIKGNHINWELTGDGDQQSLALKTSKDLFFNGTLNTQVKINWEPTLQWTGYSVGKKINFSLLNAQWINPLSFEIRTAGNNGNQFTTENEIYILSPLGQFRFTVQHQNTWHIVWLLDLNSLSDFYPNVKGYLKSRGRMNGDYNNPHFDILLEGQLNSDKENIKRAEINLNGNFEKQSLTAKIDLHHEKMNLSLNGRVKNNKTWSGTLHQFTIALNHDIHWKLSSPTQLSASKNSFDMGHTCLTSVVAGNICWQGAWSPQHLIAQAEINIDHFNWIREIVPDIRVPTGQIHADLQANGTLKEPNITGSIHLKQGSIVIPKLNITLNNVTGSLTGKNHGLNFKAEAYSLKQPINMDGVIDFSEPDFTANLKLTSNNALIMDTEQYTIYATAQLNAAIKNKNVVLTGTITVPKANVQTNDTQNTTTLPTDDIVYTGNMLPPPKPFWLVHTNVNVILGNTIHLNASGADAMLGGNVLVQQQPAGDMFGTGKIFVHTGTFSVYGQTLAIQPDSNLAFDNSLLDNPTLNLKASKVIPSLNNSISNFSEGQLIVGIELHGALRSLKIAFFSNRGNLSQADILSYLLLGYGNTTDTPGNTDLLLRALAAVNISSQGLLGKKNIATQIQNGLGLNEMGVESDTTADVLGNPLNRETAFVVGKCLTRKICARYSIGLLDPMNVDPINIFELRYLFDKHWAVQTDSSVLGNGADVLYTINRN